VIPVRHVWRRENVKRYVKHQIGKEKYILYFARTLKATAVAVAGSELTFNL